MAATRRLMKVNVPAWDGRTHMAMMTGTSSDGAAAKSRPALFPPRDRGGQHDGERAAPQHQRDRLRAARPLHAVEHQGEERQRQFQRRPLHLRAGGRLRDRRRDAVNPCGGEEQQRAGHHEQELAPSIPLSYPAPRRRPRAPGRRTPGK